MKNKKTIIIASILAVIVLISSYILFANSFAIPEQNSATLSCDKTSLSAGASTTCRLNGTSSGVGGVKGNYSVSSGLSISNVRSTTEWNGSKNIGDGKFSMFGGDTKSNFNIITFTIAAKTGTEGSNQNVSITGIQYFDNQGNAQIGDRSISLKVVSNNNYLSSLKVSGTSFSFNPNTTTYNLTVNNSSTTISASAQSGKATITGTGLKSLNYGKNTFKVNVKSEAGATRTYTLNITRPDNRSSNNYLSSLKISSGKLSFSKTKTSYNVTVGSNVSSVKVSASLADSKASYAKGYNPRTVNIGYGKTAIKIKVVAQNGATRTYTINVTRPKSGSGGKATKSGTSNKSTKKSTSKKSSDNKLKTLYLSDGSIEFDSDKYSYDVDVANSVDTITIKGDPSSDKAKVKGLGEKSLKVGSNTIEIVVTAENGDERTYVLRITRKGKQESSDLSDNNYLKDLSISGYEIDFDRETLNYDIDRNGNSSLDIKARTESSKAEVVIMGNENLKDKDEVKIVITAENGENRTYTITVHDSNNLMYTAIGIFIIGFLALLVAFAYKKKKSSSDDVIVE